MALLRDEGLDIIDRSGTERFKVVKVEGVMSTEDLYGGPPSLAIFFRVQSGLSTYKLMRFLDDLETKKIQLVYLIDVESNWKLVADLGIEFSPTTLRFDSRREVKRVVGLPPPRVFAGRLGL